MVDWVAVSNTASKGSYPDNCKAMADILDNKAWEILKFSGYTAWRKEFFPRRKKDAYDLSQAALVQQAAIGNERIGEASFEVARALAEALNEERLEEIIAALGGWRKTIKCTPKKIRDTLYQQYPGLKIKRVLSEEEAAEQRRIQNLNTLRFSFQRLADTAT